MIFIYEIYIPHILNSNKIKSTVKTFPPKPYSCGRFLTGTFVYITPYPPPPADACTSPHLHTAVSASDAYKIIGNAVPCVLAYNIAMRLAENWNNYFI